MVEAKTAAPTPSPTSKPITPEVPKAVAATTPTFQTSQKKETPSFNNIFKKKEEATENDATPTAEKRNEAFDAEKLKAAWDKFIEVNNCGGATLSLLNNTHELKANYEVDLILKSPLETNLLSNIEADLNQYLRNELKNDHLLIKPKLNLAETQKRAYTSTEIFSEMAEKNPALLKLKDALGLDSDF